MKIVFNIISILIVIAVIFLAYLNSQIAFDLTIYLFKGTKVLHSNFSQVMSVIFILGIIAGASWAAAFYVTVQKKLKEYQRKLEKTSVQTTEESSKVTVLEAKIATLEKALKSALKKEE